MRTGKILLVEAEDDLRNRLDRLFGEVGHDVASVADEEAAARLIADGLEPDVLVTQPEPAGPSSRLSGLSPGSGLLLVDRELAESKEFGSEAGVVRCPPEPAEILRRVEELLLDHRAAGSGQSEGEVCLALASRLFSALTQARTAERRIDLLVDGFDESFGVLGTFILRKNGGEEEWIEVSRGLDEPLAAQVRAEIERRSGTRGVRPFWTRLPVGEEAAEVACLPVQIGESEIDLALHLSRAPERGALREAFMNLLGNAVRSAHRADQAQRSEVLLENQDASFRSLLGLSEQFTRARGRDALCERILAALRQELGMNRSAIFMRRSEEKGMLDLQAASGFAQVRLERIGLSCFHGVGAICFGSEEVQDLSSLPREGAVSREIGMLMEVGLPWAVPIITDGKPLALLFFGSLDHNPDLEDWERGVLEALVAAARVSFRNLRAVERYSNLSKEAVRALVAAIELANPEDRGHADRVAAASLVLGRTLGLDEDTLQTLAICALLHDVGKIVAGQRGLCSPDARGERVHPILGSQILSRSHPIPELIHGVEQHHERYDGAGHPYGLAGQQIHLFGRILAICDAYDRLTTRRNEPLTIPEALRRLERGAGLLHDPGLIAVFSGAIERSDAHTSSREAPAELLREVRLA
jgi:GAF domain-containing protein